MAWFFDRANRRFHLRKAHSKNAEEILDRLKAYLDDTDQPISMLCGFWEDQQKAISYQELRALVESGVVDEVTLHLWQQDYSYLVTEMMPEVWTKAMIAGSVSQPIMESIAPVFTFSIQRPGVTEWIRSRGAYLVTSCTQTQKDAISLLLEDKIRNGYTVDELARLIRPCIGLTKGQTSAARNYYDTILRNLTEQHPRTKPEVLQARALDRMTKYAERLHRQRAMTIAQTEMAYAYNFGADEGIRQAQTDYLIGKCVKRWCTAGDENVCDECRDLDGKEIGMEETFFSGNKVEYDEFGLFPPLHPRCACAVEYIEVEPPAWMPNEDKTGLTPLSQDAKVGAEIMEHPVTEDSIAAVPLVQPEGWSQDLSKELQEAHKDILGVVQNLAIGTEACGVYTTDMTLVETRIGVLGMGEVYIPDQDFPYIAIHNHPDALPFSLDDIKNFIMRQNLKTLTAVGNEGTVYIIQKTEDYSAADFIHRLNAVIRENPQMSDSIEDYVSTIRSFLREAKQYGINYYG